MAIKINGATVIADTQAVTSTSTISATGNITGGNLVTGGAAVATGNISAANFLTSGTLSATGNISAGNISVSGVISGTVEGSFSANSLTGSTLSSNVTASSLTSTGTLGALSVTGSVNAGNLITGGAMSATGNVNGGNIATAGAISATGTVTGSSFSGTTAASTLTGSTLSSNVTASSLTSTGTLGALSVTGTATVGNVATGGTVSATGNVTGGNIATAGAISATGTVTGSSFSGTTAASTLTGSTLSSNVTGSSLTSVGTIGTGTWAATDVAVAHGGTGASDAGTARTNLGLAIGSDVQAYNATLAAVAGGTYSGDDSITTVGTIGTGVWAATDVAIAHGGTGASDAPTARTNLGLGTIATYTAGGSNGAATLDGSGTLTASQIPASLVGSVVYQGTWNANTNSPSLSSGTGTKGNYYVVSTAGSTNLDGTTDWQIGDWAIFSGTEWQKIDNTDSVTSVAGKTGAVTLVKGDVGLSNVENTAISTYAGTTSTTTVGNITTGTWSATDVAIAHGGTGASDAGTARTNLGLAIGTNVQAYNATLAAVAGGTYSGDDSITTVGNITTGTWSATDVAIAHGGTGASDAATALTNLGAYPASNPSGYVSSSGVTSVSGTAPVVSSGGATPAISMAAATASVNGYMTSTYASKLDGIAPGAQVNVATNLSTTANGTSLTVNSSTGTNASIPAATSLAWGAMTDEDKNKLDGIASGAQVNVATDLGVSANGTSLTVTSSTGTDASIPAATTTAWGVMTDEDKTKLDGIASGATNVTNNNQLTNGAGYITSSASITGSAASLTTARAINGVNFDGTAAITVEPYIEDDNATNATRYITFVDNTTAGYKRLNEDSTLNYNPSTGTLSATVFSGVATTARYADLAENYVGDAAIEPGTVVEFGGDAEVTSCAHDMCARVAGVVSTKPAYLMNNGLEAEHVIAVAFTGRVPCKVVGTVRKGDLMVSAGNGMARAEANPAPGTIIGKALANHDGAEGVIEVVVGRF